MKQINIHEAKTNLSKLIEKVELGEKIIIANRGVPKAILSKYTPKTNSALDSPLGRYAGQIKISNDFNDEDDEINRLFGI